MKLFSVYDRFRRPEAARLTFQRALFAYFFSTYAIVLADALQRYAPQHMHGIRVLGYAVSISSFVLLLLLLIRVFFSKPLHGTQNAPSQTPAAFLIGAGFFIMYVLSTVYSQQTGHPIVLPLSSMISAASAIGSYMYLTQGFRGATEFMMPFVKVLEEPPISLTSADESSEVDTTPSDVTEV